MHLFWLLSFLAWLENGDKLEFLQAYALTVGMESALLYFLVRKQYRPEVILRNGVIASTFTLPFVWFVFPSFGLPWLTTFLISESFAVVVEGVIYIALFKDMVAKQAFLISLACNFLSLSVGLMLN